MTKKKKPEKGKTAVPAKSVTVQELLDRMKAKMEQNPEAGIILSTGNQAVVIKPEDEEPER